MSEKKVFPKGISFFEPRAGAPTWVKGSVIISMRDLVDWVKANPDVLTEHEKYGKQLKLTVTEKGMHVDTWKPNAGKSQSNAQNAPKRETLSSQAESAESPLPF